MGNSSSAVHSEGERVYGRRATWPAAVRQRWDQVAGSARARWAGSGPAPPPTAPSGATSVDVREVFKDPERSARVEKLARSTGLDAADVARIWARCGGADPTRALRAVRWRADLVRRVMDAVRAGAREHRVRLPRSTLDDVESRAVAAAVGLPLELTKDWEGSPAGKRFLRAVLGEPD